MYDNRILAVFESIDRTLKRIAQVLEDEHSEPEMVLIPVPNVVVSEDNENVSH
jgi:hypothetical protein